MFDDCVFFIVIVLVQSDKIGELVVVVFGDVKGWLIDVLMIKDECNCVVDSVIRGFFGDFEMFDVVFGGLVQIVICKWFDNFYQMLGVCYVKLIVVEFDVVVWVVIDLLKFVIVVVGDVVMVKS